MDKVFNMLISLYKGESVLKKHMFLALLLVLPSLSGCILGYIDKETPRELYLPLFLLGVILLFVSIIPAICLSGMSLSFIHNKYHDKEEGIPMLNKDMFMTGLKAIPLYLVWLVYWLIFFVVVTLLCFSPAIIVALNGNISDNTSVAAMLFVLSMFVFICLCFAMYFLIPFATYVSVSYAKDFEYTSNLFNPLIILDFIKKSFKSSVLVALKYIVINLLAGFASSIVYVVGFIFIFFIAIIAFATSSNIEVVNSPIFVGPTIVMASFMAWAQVYISTVIGYGMNGNLVEVYKAEIDT